MDNPDQEEPPSAQALSTSQILTGSYGQLQTRQSVYLNLELDDDQDDDYYEDEQRRRAAPVQEGEEEEGENAVEEVEKGESRDKEKKSITPATPTVTTTAKMPKPLVEEEEAARLAKELSLQIKQGQNNQGTIKSYNTKNAPPDPYTDLYRHKSQVWMCCSLS